MTLKIEAGKYYRTRDGQKVGPMYRTSSDFMIMKWNCSGGVGWSDRGSVYMTVDDENDIIAEWTDAPAHIITHNGREYDLTALETPFGILLEKAPPVAEALEAWPHGFEYYSTPFQPHEWATVDEPTWAYGTVYRAKPAPAEVRVKCVRFGEGHFAERGTCITRADGTIDWSTWEPMP
jgi:hypothetical protein